MAATRLDQHHLVFMENHQLPVLQAVAGSARGGGNWHAIPVRENRAYLPREHEKVAGESRAYFPVGHDPARSARCRHIKISLTATGAQRRWTN